MEKFTTIKSIAISLPLSNIDTDMIIPKQFLKTTERTGLGKHLFHEMRYDKDGNEKENSEFNQERYKNAQIIIGGENFGCGSSREHAPWALLDYGIKCIIAPSFADIFYQNCSRNGILLIKLNNQDIKDFAASGQEMEINLTEKYISFNSNIIYFSIDEETQSKLLEGQDAISLTLEMEDKIQEFEQNHIIY